MTSTTIDYGYTEEHVQSVGIEAAADANKSLRRHHLTWLCLLQADRFYLLFVGLSFVLTPLNHAPLSTVFFFVWNFVSSVTNSHDILSPEEGSDIQ